MRSREDALQDVTRDAQLLAVPGEQVLKAFGRVIDVITRVVFDLFDSPIPDRSQMPQPAINLPFLSRAQLQFYLRLNQSVSSEGWSTALRSVIHRHDLSV